MKSNKTDKTVSKGCKEKRYHQAWISQNNAKDCKRQQRVKKIVKTLKDETKLLSYSIMPT